MSVDAIRARSCQEGAYRVIGLDALKNIARESTAGVPLTPARVRRLEIDALRQGIVPHRYLRNMGTIGLEGQIRLLESTVAVAGAGGLGGWVVEGLARMGIGRLIVIDGDIFAENNLNRQALCTESELGRRKIEVAQQRVEKINSAVDCTGHFVRAGEKDFCKLLSGAEVAVDALDNMPSRFDLQRAAQALGIPMIHGAIGGWIGQVMTIFPGDPGLFALYREETAPEHGIEVECGNPTATPLMVAACQIQEVVKVLLQIGLPLRDRILMLDAESGTAEIIRLSSTV